LRRRADRLFRRKLEVFVVAAEDSAECFDDQFVILTHGKAGDGDAADDAGVDDAKREGTAVGSVVGERKALALVDGFAFQFFVQRSGVGTVVEAGDDVSFAAHPFGIVGRGAIHGGVEERVTEAADIDDDGQIALASDGVEL